MGDPTLQELAARLVELERANARMAKELSDLQDGRAAASKQSLPSTQATPGTFSSSTIGTPAVKATGTNGTNGLDVSSDSGTSILASSASGIGIHVVGGGVVPTTTLYPPALFAEGGITGAVVASSIKGGNCISGTSTGGQGDGVVGTSDNGTGVSGQSTGGPGVSGQSTVGPGIVGISTNNYGVSATSTSGPGVWSISTDSYGVHASTSSGIGVYAHSDSGHGVLADGGDIGVSAQSQSGFGVYAVGGGASLLPPPSPLKTAGVFATGGDSYGVVGTTDNVSSIGPGPSAGILGVANAGIGVSAQSASGLGVHAVSGTNSTLNIQPVKTAGVFAEGADYGVVGTIEGVIVDPKYGSGVAGFADAGVGVTAITNTGNAIQAFSETGTAVLAFCNSGVGIRAKGGKYAGEFLGSVTIIGDLMVGSVTTIGDLIVRNITASGDLILAGADCAEEFDIVEATRIEPGTVMVIDQDGALQQSWCAYDKRVAGVISGAGDYKAGLILDRRQSQDNRLPVALVGKVYCKVDAQYAAIEVGDLLTTSPTLGHAMKADDPYKAFGSVIGKALRPLQVGQGIIPILIALQ